MDVRQSEVFLAVAEELSFSRAAQRLHIAQPPLSRMIQRIETDLGRPLFVRSTRSVELTPLGEALLEPARAMVNLSEQMREIARRSQKGLAGRLRVAFSGASIARQVSELAQQLTAMHPGVTLELFNVHSHEELEMLRSGKLDIAIGRWDFLPADLASRVITTEELVVAVSAKHPLAAQASVTAEQLVDELWVSAPGGSSASLPNRLHLLMSRANAAPRLLTTGWDPNTRLLLVSAGTGIALTPESVAKEPKIGGLRFLPLTPSLGPVELRITWRASDTGTLLRQTLAVAETVFPNAPALGESATKQGDTNKV